MMNRRSVVKGALGLGILAADRLYLPPWLAAQQESKRQFTADPRRFGAAGDGRTKDTHALQQAIDACFQAGGGTVLVPAGNYLIGTIVLKSNITLSLQAGATLLGSTNVADYILPPEAPASVRSGSPRHLIFAYKANNISIQGPGAIDGRSQHFLVRTDRPEPRSEDLWKEVIAFNWKRTIGISPMVELGECTNVHIENVTLQNSVGWALRPIGCDSVLIRGVRIRNPIYASNADGIDPTSCQNVIITDCDIFTGDDAICLKTSNIYGEDKVCRNITVTNCRLSTCCSGFRVGIEGPGGFENINFSNSIIYSNDVPFNQRVLAGIAIQMVDNGWIDGVTVSNIEMRNVRAPIMVRLQNKIGAPAPAMTGRLKSVKISNVRATGAILTSSITGIPQHMVEDVTLDGIQISTSEPGRAEWAQNHLLEREDDYPGPQMFGRFPCYGLYARHVKDLRLSNVRIASQTKDPRPMLVCEDVQGLDLTKIDGTPSGDDLPFLDLRNVQNASIHGNTAPAGTKIYARISGAESQNIRLADNVLPRVEKAIDLAPDLPKGAVTSQ